MKELSKDPWCIYMRKWRERKKKLDPNWKDYYNPRFDKEYNLKKKYGLTGEDFELKLKEQKGLCALCQKEKATCVDHNHKTKKIRAILCRKCNSGLGQFGDDIELLRIAIIYLEAYA